MITNYLPVKSTNIMKKEVIIPLIKGDWKKDDFVHTQNPTIKLEPCWTDRVGFIALKRFNIIKAEYEIMFNDNKDILPFIQLLLPEIKSRFITEEVLLKKLNSQITWRLPIYKISESFNGFVAQSTYDKIFKMNDFDKQSLVDYYDGKISTENNYYMTKLVSKCEKEKSRLQIITQSVFQYTNENAKSFDEQLTEWSRKLLTESMPSKFIITPTTPQKKKHFVKLYIVLGNSYIYNQVIKKYIMHESNIFIAVTRSGLKAHSIIEKLEETAKAQPNNPETDDKNIRYEYFIKRIKL